LGRGKVIAGLAGELGGAIECGGFERAKVLEEGVPFRRGEWSGGKCWAGEVVICVAFEEESGLRVVVLGRVRCDEQELTGAAEELLVG
jgi:hypothetical protein